MAGIEKRQHPRFPVGITMDIHAKGQTVSKCRGTITDLSVSGMTFRTSAELEEGSVLFLKINIPLEIRGEIRHIRAGSTGGMHRYGVRFHRIGFEVIGQERPESFVTAKFHKG
ncbi:MAG: PilZ domain-containing protein [Elusimicrobiota bacterium]